MSDDKNPLDADAVKETEEAGFEQLRERLKEAEAVEVEAELVAQEDVKPMKPAEQAAPVIEAQPLLISDKDRKELPFVANGLLFVVCGTSERGFNLGRIVQIIPVDDDAQCVLVYDMKTEENPFITQIVQHRVADIRKALS